VVASGALVAAACGGGDDATTDSGAPGSVPSTLEPVPDDASTDTTTGPATAPPRTDAEDPGSADTIAPSPAPPTEPPVGQAAAPDAPEILQVTAPVVGGGELDLAAYGDRPLLLWFWAPF
jgi:hypothetical protein